MFQSRKLDWDLKVGMGWSTEEKRGEARRGEGIGGRRKGAGARTRGWRVFDTAGERRPAYISRENLTVDRKNSVGIAWKTCLNKP